MASKVARPCQRNDCPAPARAGVELSHADKVAVLVDLPVERDPRRMELCADHASRMSVPRGWTRVDDREVEVEDDRPPQGPPTVAELTSLSTLEVLTAALESVPDAEVAPGGDSGAVDPRSDSPGSVDVEALEPDAGDLEALERDTTESDDGPSMAAVMAASLARVPPLADEPGSEVGADSQPDVAGGSHAGPEADDEVLEEITEDGTQLVLAAAARMARNARPVPAARTD